MRQAQKCKFCKNRLFSSDFMGKKWKLFRTYSGIVLDLFLILFRNVRKMDYFISILFQRSKNCLFYSYFIPKTLILFLFYSGAPELFVPNTASGHILQGCNDHFQVRRALWPQETSLESKLFGNLHDLRRTAAFVKQTYITI